MEKIDSERGSEKDVQPQCLVGYRVEQSALWEIAKEIGQKICSSFFSRLMKLSVLISEIKICLLMNIFQNFKSNFSKLQVFID